MDFAVIETGGKQYKVVSGQILEVEKLGKTGGAVVFDRVLLHAAGSYVSIGAPYLQNVAVSAKVLGEVKGEKIDVLRFLAKSRHRRKMGFRPVFTKVQIESIHNSQKFDSAPVKEKASVKPSKTAKKK